MGVNMTSLEKAEYDDISQFEGLTNYVEVLMNEFPRPIARKELAQKMGISQAAITKVKDKLYKLCDHDRLVFNSRIILKTDKTTFLRLFILQFLRMEPAKILLSKYGREMIKRMDIHNKISQQFKEYSVHFNEKDTENVIKIALYNLKNFQAIDEIRTRIKDPQQRAMLLSFKFAASMENIIKKFDLPMENSDDLIGILTLRDKLFYLIKQLICQRVEKASILEELSKTEKALYLKVYSQTIDFYLKKLFEIGTDYVSQLADRKNIDFERNYEKIGYFYRYSQPETAFS